MGLDRDRYRLKTKGFWVDFKSAVIELVSGTTEAERLEALGKATDDLNSTNLLITGRTVYGSTVRFTDLPENELHEFVNKNKLL